MLTRNKTRCSLTYTVLFFVEREKEHCNLSQTRDPKVLSLQPKLKRSSRNTLSVRTLQLHCIAFTVGAFSGVGREQALMEYDTFLTLQNNSNNCNNMQQRQQQQQQQEEQQQQQQQKQQLQLPQQQQLQLRTTTKKMSKNNKNENKTIKMKSVVLAGKITL